MQPILLLLFLLSFLVAMSQQQRLLYEPNAPDYRASCFQQSLFDKLAPDPALSTFMDVLTQVDDIFKLLNNTDNAQDNQFTVFCPVNSAFQNELDVYTRDHLDDFLRNHIIPNSKIDADTLKRLHSPLQTMLPGETIKVKYYFFSKRIVLNDHAIVDTDAIEAINGIAYKINHLLRPYGTG
ncbi:uncharacterized protein ATC70_010332 [Mucor velutinosus]|uniref:FAS1 domain-containing protein n=1 Tax=Mucor velutinosus TaxID=708070 RepID=A0AAN7DDE4_9FUNG|nr:hypothetical protein ATC70_010332 [Mucor velutinosus]